MQILSQDKYGYQDNSFKAAGEFTGVKKLVDCFYDIMTQLPQAQVIRAMHPADLSISKEKLTYFLCGWLGGPRDYVDRFGPINIPQVHRHLTIESPERDAWLLCMEQAIAQQPYKPAFKTYLLRQLAIPAERIRVTSQGKTG